MRENQSFFFLVDLRIFGFWNLEMSVISGVISRQVLPACGSLCFFCPAMRARSRQPIKRYKKLIASIFPRNQVSILLSSVSLTCFSLFFILQIMKSWYCLLVFILIVYLLINLCNYGFKAKAISCYFASLTVLVRFSGGISYFLYTWYWYITYDYSLLFAL